MPRRRRNNWGRWGEPGRIPDVYPVTFLRPLEQPVRVAQRKVDAAVRLFITEPGAPVSAVQGARLVKIHGPGHVLQVVIVGTVSFEGPGHSFGGFFDIDLE